MRSEFEKESDSGTNLASDPAHGDPGNVRLLGHNTRNDPLYLTVCYTNHVLIYSNIRYPARRTKNYVNTPSMFRATPFIYLFILDSREYVQ